MAIAVQDQSISNSGNAVKVSVTADYSLGSTLASTSTDWILNTSINSTTVWYPSFLLEDIIGTNQNGNDYDISIQFNEILTWDLSTGGGSAGSNPNLMYVIMHEFSHGMGVLSSASYNSGSGTYTFGWSGSPNIYDLSLEDSGGNLVWGNSNYQTSAQLGPLFTSDIFFENIDLYDPSTWSGQSVSHFEGYSGSDQLMLAFYNISTIYTSVGSKVNQVHSANGWGGGGSPTPPTAAFSGTPTSGDVPLVVSFTDASTQGSDPITSWSWDFGDSGTSTDEDPQHTYTSDGTYTVTLTVSDGTLSDDEVKTNYITVSNVGPTAAFSGTPVNGYIPLDVQFTDASTAGTNPITSWSWDFGDSGTSTDEDPQHTYTAAGTYTVTLIVSDGTLSDTETKTNYITTSVIVGPTAGFSGTPVSGDAPLVVQFDDESTQGSLPITSWAWDFGDGTGTSTDANPQYTYTSAGTYTVTLTVSDGTLSDDEVKTDYITVTTAVVTPVAEFSANTTSGVAPLSVVFTDESTNTPTSWSWTFGDGGTSTDEDPTHNYTTPGTYTVVLTATNSAGSDDETKTDYITVTTAVVTPVAEFSANTTSGVAPLSVVFTDESTNTPTSWSWTFGDGGTSTDEDPTHNYTTPGTYTVVLTATNSAGSDDETKTDYITVTTVTGPTANFSGSPVNGDVPLVVSFTDASTQGTDPITSWAWDFGDGNTSTDEDPSHTYTNAGSYTVSLTVSDGSLSDDEVKVDYINVATPVLSLDPSSETVGPNAGSITTDVICDSNWDIDASTIPGWIDEIFPTSGDGNTAVTIIYGEHTGGTANRTANIVFNRGTTLTATYSLTQDFPVLMFDDTDTLEVPPNEGDTTTGLIANCDWTLEISYSNGGNWLTIDPVTGTDDMTLSIHHDENTNNSARDALIKITGCGLVIEKVVNQDFFTGIDDIVVDENRGIYPNPCRTFTNIKLKKDDSQLMIYDLQGRRIQMEIVSPYGNEDMRLNVNNYIQGAYFVMILNSKGVLVFKGKLIKQ